MPSSKAPCVNRKANKHSPIVLTLDPGDKPFRDDTDIQPAVTDNHSLKYTAAKAKNSNSPKITGKFKFTLKAASSNKATLTVRGKPRADAIPDGTLSITLTNYPDAGTTTPLLIDTEYVLEEEP